MDEESTKYKCLKLRSHTAFRQAKKETEVKNANRRARIEHAAPLMKRLREMKDAADKRDRVLATEELEVDRYPVLRRYKIVTIDRSE